MSRNETTNRNMCSVIDAVDFILTHEDKLTSTEKSNIQDPISISRALFRRILGKIFSDFEIRKNIENYSIRCTNADIYNGLRFYNMMRDALRNRTEKIEKKLYQELSAQQQIASTFFSLFEGRNISYKLRDDNRFFIYVNHMPYTHRNAYDYDQISTYRTYSLKSRIELITEVSDAMQKFKLAPIAEKFLSFVTKYGQWSIGYLPRSTANESITEEFIDFAMTLPNGTSLINALLDYDAQKNTKAMEQLRKEQEIEQEKTKKRQQVEEEARKRIADEAQQRFNDALSRVSQRRTPVQAETTEVQEPTPAANRFQDALSRILSDRNQSDERFLRLDIFDEPQEPEYLEFEINHLTDMFSEVDDNEYIRLLNIIPENEGLRTIFNPCNQDVSDDLDVELHGVYFKVEGLDIKYLVYIENELVLETQDFNTATSLYLSRYDKLEEIRYLEDVTHVSN